MKKKIENKETRKKSIKGSIIIALTLLFLFTILTLGLMFYRTTYNELIIQTENDLIELAKMSAKIIDSRIDGEFKVLETIAGRYIMKDEGISMEEKLETLKEEEKKNNYHTMAIVDESGNAIFITGEKTNIKDREYFLDASTTGRGISEPMVSRVDNRINVFLTVPIKSNTKTIGYILAALEGDILTSVVEDIQFSESGRAFMISKDGTFIAHENRELVLNMDNNFENIKNDPELEELVKLQEKMVKGETGVGIYSYNGERKILGYAPIISANWSIGINVLESEVLIGLSKVKNIIALGILISIIISFIIMNYIITRIVEPVGLLDKNLGQIAAGDLTVKVSDEYLKLDHEFGRLARSEQKLIDSINQVIGGIKRIGEDVETNSMDLSAASQQLAASAEQVAAAVQEIAKNSEFQATNLIEVNNILTQFDKDLRNMLDAIKEVDDSSREIYHDIEISDENMQNLTSAIENTENTLMTFIDKILDLGNSIVEIDKITELINEISEQTNLLALNAAIEAARAGDSGRGFAVVAEEIRKLAEETKTSIEDINNIIHKIHGEVGSINNSIEEINREMENQQEVAITTMDIFKIAMDSIRNVVNQITNINESTINVSEGKEVILEKVEEISSEAQEVSAASQEIAASAEEMSSSVEEVAASAESLSGMTEAMMEEVNKFKILEN